MSGGSYDYAYHKVRDLGESIRDQDKNPRRAAFAALMLLAAEAAHDIEWVDSCDYGPGDENAAIDKVLAFLKADPETVKKARAYDVMAAHLKKLVAGLEG